MITVLAGGVGAARFLQGLLNVADPATVTIISNTGDDTTFAGLHVSPDTDIVIYSLAGAINAETGWGLSGDTFVVADALQRYGHDRWFNLGDRDLATALHRTALHRAGTPMHEVVAGLARAWGLTCTVLPMTNAPVQTRVVDTAGASYSLQEFMVRERGLPEVATVTFEGADASAPAPGVLEALTVAETVILTPSNPFLSIGPILAVPGLRQALENAKAARVAISPIIDGKAVKGPAASMLRSLGHEVSALGVAQIYAGLIDAIVIDSADAALAPAIEALGVRVCVTETLMTDDGRKAALARATLEAASL